VTVQAWFSASDVEVAPGSVAVLSLTVTNLGATTQSFALNPSGLAASWTTVRPAFVTLFGGSEQAVDVEVHPPRLPTTPAGPTALGVRVIPESDPNAVETVETTLVVLPTHDRRITVLQPALRSRRRAVFEFMVENQGNAQASCRLRLVDPSQRVDGDFDPPAVGVEPAGSSLVRLKLTARRRQWERRSRALPFRVEADQQGTPTVDARATLVQAPMLPEQLWSRLAAALLLAAGLAGAWFGVVRPAIDDAARDAVADESAAVTIPTTLPGAPVVPTTAPPAAADPVVAPAPDDDEGEPFSVVLPSGAAIGAPSRQAYGVPAGSTLQITDVIVQNPALDQGSALVQIGTLPFRYDLANLLFGSSETLQLVTPIELSPGEEVALEVTCAAVGDPALGTCSATLFVSGRVVPTT